MFVEWRLRRRRVEQPEPKSVLIDPAGRFDPRFENLERRGEKPGEAKQPLSAAIDVRARFETARHQPGERSDGLVAPSQPIVETENFDDDSGPEVEWRGRALARRVLRGATEYDFSLE